MHACNLPLLARGLSIDSHAHVIRQHARWPIRTPHPTCANQDAWVVITPKRPKANSIDTAAWRALRRTPSLNFVSKAVFSRLIYLPLTIVPFWFGGIEIWLGVIRRTNRYLTEPIRAFTQDTYGWLQYHAIKYNFLLFTVPGTFGSMKIDTFWNKFFDLPVEENPVCPIICSDWLME